jgi:hypothetical protein
VVVEWWSDALEGAYTFGYAEGAEAPTKQHPELGEPVIVS